MKFKSVAKWGGVAGIAAGAIYLLTRNETPQNPVTQKANDLAAQAQATFCDLYPDSPLCKQDWTQGRPVGQAPANPSNPTYGETLT